MTGNGSAIHERLADARNKWDAGAQQSADFENIANLLCRTDQKDELLQFLEETRGGPYPTWPVYDAGYRISTGAEWGPDNLDSAPDYDPETMPAYLRGLDCFKRIWAAREAEASPDIEIVKPITSNPSHICVVSCDTNYFGWFFEDFYKSFNEYAKGGDAVHFHLVNPSDHQIEMARALRGANLGISIERAPECPTAYYACARFFAARVVLDTYNANVIIVDFDAVFHSSMSDRFPNLPHIAGRRVQAPKVPWQIWMAGFTALPNTPNSREYLDSFAQVTLPLLREKGLEHWYVDQCALAVLMHRDGFVIVNDWKRSGELIQNSSKFTAEKLKLR